MTKFPEVFAALSAQFEAAEVKILAKGGRQLQYVTARTVANRLDDVLGPENWWDDYTPHENSVLCRLTIRLPDGSTLTKCDAGGYAGMADSGDDDKSGYSDAFKRAAAKVTVGRYLYRDGVPSFGHETEHREPARASHADRPGPSQQYPAPTGGRDPQANGHADQPRKYDDSRPPTTGRALFAWSKSQEEKYEIRLVEYLNKFIKANDFPGRMVDLDADQVRRCHAEAVHKIASIHADGDRDAGSEG